MVPTEYVIASTKTAPPSRDANNYVLVRNVVFPQISFSSTSGFTWRAGGVLSIESERTVGITAGTSITMNNPAVAASTSF